MRSGRPVERLIRLPIKRPMSEVIMVGLQVFARVAAKDSLCGLLVLEIFSSLRDGDPRLTLRDRFELPQALAYFV